MVGYERPTASESGNVRNGVVVGIAIVGMLVVIGLFAYAQYEVQLQGVDKRTAELFKEHTFVITVSGDFGFLCWDGALGGTKTGSSSVEGCGDKSWTIVDTNVAATFQKKSEYGTLSLKLTKDGISCLMQSTEASYGVVSGGC